MVEIWYTIAALMLTTYVVLDGFDFGAGALHLFVAKGDRERRQVLASIGPFWDGNEVWLIASAGVLFVAFPKALASGFSGFYFALFMVLWVLILRGIAIEFRSHVEQPLWRSAWDVVFSVASLLMPVLLGAALGNLLRGLPLNAEGWFSLPLFTDFTTSGAIGILDWYTILIGVFALLALTGHGGTYLAWKTDSTVHARSRTATLRCYAAVLVLWPVVTAATALVNPTMYDMLPYRPPAWAGLASAIGGIMAVFLGLRREWPLAAFLGSSAFLAGLLGATAALLFPDLLRATTGDHLSITAYNGSSAPSSLRIALGWWVIAAPLAVTYFVILFRMHRGKATVPDEGEGY